MLWHRSYKGVLNHGSSFFDRLCSALGRGKCSRSEKVITKKNGTWISKVRLLHLVEERNLDE